MREKIYNDIACRAIDLLPKLQVLRRDFHMYAEIGWCEIRTTSFIAESLKRLGYKVFTGREVCLECARLGLPSQKELDKQYQRALEQGALQPWAEQARDGFTGVIGFLDCGEGPCIGMRFDIDALNVFEDTGCGHRPNAEGFASVNSGVMHACGHDGHAAIGLGVAELLISIQSKLRGKIKLIFQPAEEGVRGAKAIVEHGHLDDVDYILGNHIGFGADSMHQIGLMTSSTLATSKLDVLFLGKPSHAGAAPELGNNAMLAAATAVLNLQALPRCGTGASQINVGILNAGTERNVICDRAELKMEVRGETVEINQYMEDYARRIIEAAAKMHGCSNDISLVGSAEPLSSDQELIERCSKVCQEQLNLHVAPMYSIGQGSEDYAYMVNRVRSHGGQGLFFHTIANCAASFHSKEFDFHEDALSNAVKVFCGLTYNLMEYDK